MKINSITGLAMVCCYLSVFSPTLRGDDKKADDKTSEKSPAAVELFNGKNLDGWKITECDVAVEDGALVLKKGEGFLYVDHRYRDFVLELDWKSLKPEKYDSGVYIRCELPAAGKHWPSRYQMNLKEDDEGDLLGVPNAKKLGLIKKGDWNQFKLTVVGSGAVLEINGKPAWKADGLKSADGYIGIQSEVTAGGQHAFKNIRVTEITEKK